MRNSKSYIAHLGVYLPAKQVSTEEIIKGCRNPIRIPLERLTGIRSRHMAGEEEFAIDLAAKAMEDCSGPHRHGPGRIRFSDLLQHLAI